MVLSTSAVAVCCCSDSRSSFSSRTFSIAITAWSAKVATSSTCFSVKGRTVDRCNTITDSGSFAQQRDAEHGANVEFFPVDQRVIRISLNIGDVNYFPFKHGSPGDRTSTRRNRVSFHVFPVLGRIAIRGEMFEKLSHWARYGRHVRLAQSRRGFDQRVEHRLQIECRAADDLEHVSGGRLLLQRFPQLGEQARVLDGNYSLSSEVGEQFNLLGGKGSHFLAVNGESADEVIFLEHGHDY